MPSFNKSIYGRQLTWVSPSGAPTYASGQLLFNHTGWKNAVQSRKRPPEPLYESMTPLVAQHTLRSSPASKKHTGYGTSFRYGFPGTPGEAPDPDWALKLRLRIQDLSANLSSAVAEVERTADGFISFARNLNKIRKLVTKRKPNVNFCEVSSTHLAVHFGIKPVVLDLYAATTALDAVIDDPPVIRVSAQAKATSRYKTSTLLSNPEWIEEGVWEVSKRAVVYVRPKLGLLGKLDLGNPAEWAWERVPFSFVVDWAIPIGDYLTACFALQNVDVVSKVSVTTKTSYNGTMSANNSYSAHKAHETGAVTYQQHSRAIYDSIPLPRLPSLDITDSLLAIQHATALLHQLRRCR